MDIFKQRHLTENYLYSSYNSIKHYLMKWRERLIWLVLLIGALLIFRACDNGCNIFSGDKRLKDTISDKIDTVFVPVKGDTVYVPELVGVSNTIYQIKWKHDTLETFEVRIDPADTAAILARCNQSAFYSDKRLIGNYGTITINDTLSQNRIVSRGVTTDLKIPEVTRTITLRDKRTVGYIGVSGMGNEGQPLHSLGLDFSLKLKSDYILGVGTKFTKSGQMYYEAQFKAPIRLKRK